MYLLYLDDAGAVANTTERHFVLGGVCLFERQAYFLADALDQLVQQLGHAEPETLELHGSAIAAGRGWWRRMHRDKRNQIIRQALGSFSKLRGDWCLFGVVVDKIVRSPEDPVEYAFEQLCNRFDLFLRRQYVNNGQQQRGLIILDRSTRETRLQNLATRFRNHGHRWGTLRNIVDVPFFVDSQATRLIQYADLVSYAIYRRFEKNDPEFFDVINNCFDSEGAVVHGLVHFKDRVEMCDCPACLPPLLARMSTSSRAL